MRIATAIFMLVLCFTVSPVYAARIGNVKMPVFQTPGELVSLAEQGSTEAQFTLGYMYANGIAFTKDNSKAMEWFQKAVEQFQEAAKSGSAEAQFNLGYLYAYGEGVARDERKAVEWYKKAVEQEHAIALIYLGYMYTDGRGVDKDMSKAAELFQQAAQAAMYTQLDMSFSSLVNRLASEMPISVSKLNELGIPLSLKSTNVDRTYYAGGPILLNDGILLDKFDLRVIDSKNTTGTFFTFTIQEGIISRQTVDAELGQFRIYAGPTGSSWEESVTFIKNVEEYSILAGYSQLEKDRLIALSFDAITRRKQ
jgi:tetratricopeptide (TPR) repeat protein